MTTDDAGLTARLERIFAARDRGDMGPTIAAFLAVLDEHPDDPGVLYQVGGAYDTDGQEALAAEYYDRAMRAGLDGLWLQRCYLQYGSTLRNLGRLGESVALFDEGVGRFPDAETLVLFRALALHEAGEGGRALASVLTLVADRIPSDEVRRFEPALRGYAAELAAGERGEGVGR